MAIMGLPTNYFCFIISLSAFFYSSNVFYLFQWLFFNNTELKIFSEQMLLLCFFFYRMFILKLLFTNNT